MTRIVVYIILVLSISFRPASSALDRFHIDSNRDSRFLPYKFISVECDTYSDCRKIITTTAHVIKPGIVGGDSAFYARGYNALVNEDATGSIFVKTYGGQIEVENPTFMTISDFGVFYDRQFGQNVIASGCYIHDSAFVERIIPFPRQRDRLFLTTGLDHTGNGRWEPDILFIKALDYDYDGIQEVFFHVNPVRDKEPRILFCLDLQNMNIEWSLPVASNMQRNNIVSCNDSLHPAVIFGTYPPSQGTKDEYFNDSYSYITKVNGEGKVVFHKLTGNIFNWSEIIPGLNDSTFFVTYSLPFLDPVQADSSLRPECGIAMIDRDGNVIKAVSTENPVDFLWFADFDSDGSADLYAKFHNKKVKIYTPNLDLTAESENHLQGDYLGSTRIAGEKEPVMIFGDSGLTVYSNRFDKLANAGLENSFGYFEELVHDSVGNTAVILAGGNNRYFIAGINRISFAKLLNIYIEDFRYYLLGTALTLLVILIAMTVYRIRMKRHLVMILRQKQEIEKTHGELKKAYMELEIAGETIAVQREREAAASQYRIASAQFRHEINNALGAVKLFVSNAIQRISANKNQNMFEERYNSLSKELTSLMEKLPELDPEIRERLTVALKDMRDLDEKLLNGLEEIVLRGINRGLGLSEKLRSLERIDYDSTIEDVDLNRVIDTVLKESSSEIKQQQINVRKTGDPDAIIKGSEQLFEIMIRNLLNNSIEAIDASESDLREIMISVGKPSVSKLEIVWQDSGIGIDKDKFERIFQPFYTEKPKTGSGLGLSMVRNIVGKYKGKIEIESVKGEFTKFKIDFDL